MHVYSVAMVTIAAVGSCSIFINTRVNIRNNCIELSIFALCQL